MSDVKNCGSCGNFNGAKLSCRNTMRMVPQSETDHCSQRYWVPKVSEKKSCGTCAGFVSDRKGDRCEISGVRSSGPLSVEAHWGGGCSVFLPKTAQRHVDEYKAETGVSIPVEALRADLQGRFKKSSVACNPESFQGVRDSYMFTQKAGGIGIVLEDADVVKFDDVGPRGVSSKEHEILFGIGKRNLYYVNSPKKETSTMNAIIRLADSQLNREMEEFGALPVDIRDALVSLQERAKKEAAEGAATEVMKLLTQANKSVEFQVSTIRGYRKGIDIAKDELAKLSRAKAYGLETSNFIPLAILSGQLNVSNVENKDLTKVPEDWAPAETKLPVSDDIDGKSDTKA